MSRVVIPRAYIATIFSSKPAKRRSPFLTTSGSKLPLRSRGASMRTGPWSVCSVLGVVPLRVLPAPPGGSALRLIAQVLGQLGGHRALHQPLDQVGEQAAGPDDLLLRARARASEQLVDERVAEAVAHVVGERREPQPPQLGQRQRLLHELLGQLARPQQLLDPVVAAAGRLGPPDGPARRHFASLALRARSAKRRRGLTRGLLRLDPAAAMRCGLRRHDVSFRSRLHRSSDTPATLAWPRSIRSTVTPRSATPSTPS